MNVSEFQLDAIEEALAYIESNLTQSLRIEEISQHVGYSLFHFSRIFNAATFISPYTYLMRRRITEAASQILNTRQTMTTIANTYGFQSSEVFGRSIHRMLGVLPTVLRKKGDLDPRLLLPALQRHTLADWQAFRGISLQEKLLPELRLRGLMMQCENTPDARKSCWQTFNRIFPRISDAHQYAIRFFPPGWKTDGILYFIGTTPSPCQPRPADWVIEKNFPAHSVLTSCQPVPLDQLDALINLFQCAWFPDSPYRADIPYLIEDYSMEINLVSLHFAVCNKKN